MRPPSKCKHCGTGLGLVRTGKGERYDSKHPWAGNPFKKDTVALICPKCDRIPLRPDTVSGNA